MALSYQDVIIFTVEQHNTITDKNYTAKSNYRYDIVAQLMHLYKRLA